MLRLSRALWMAALVGWSASAAAAGTPIDQANKEQLRAAQKTFLAADELFDAKRFEEALTAYRASYEIVASPNSRLQIARSLREIGRLVEAYRELVGTTAEARELAKKDDKYQATARAAGEELEALKKRVALLRVELVNAPAGTQLSVAEREVDPATLAEPLVLVPGSIRIVAKMPEREDVTRELTLAAGSSSTLELDLTPGAVEKPVVAAAPQPVAPARTPTEVRADTSSTPLRTWAWVAGGVGLAGLATFGVFGALNNSKFSDLESSCPEGHCAPDRGEDIDAGRRYQTIANVGLVVGVVGLGAGTALFFSSSGEKETSARRRRPWVSVGAGSVHVRGQF